MKVVMTAKAFHDKLIHIARELPTTYKNKYPYNLGYYNSNKVWSWDCWNLPKSLIWGWQEKEVVGYHARYDAETGLGDWTGSQIIAKCYGVSTDFSNLTVGEFLLSPDAGHAGIYVGERVINSKTYNVVECSPIWANGVQLTYVSKTGARYRYKDGAKAATGWGKHGKLPWIDYNEQPTPPEPKPEPEENVYYTVKRGDNLTKIGKQFGVSVSELVAWNKIVNPNLIFVGQKLIVGKKTPTPEPTKEYYVVKRGDNLSRIAKAYGTSVAQLVAWNNIKNPNLIFVGQTLRVR